MTFLVAACGGGGGGNVTDTGGDNSPAPATGNCQGSGSVTISGTVTYAFVPAVHTEGGEAFLDFDASEARPVRRADVRAICPDGSSVHASTTTSETGEYELTVPENVDVRIRVRALMQKSGSPSWDLRVVDNTRDQGVWTLEGETFDSGTGSATVNLHAASGWTGSGYTESRAAAPFAIMDSMYVAMQKVLAADADANFPALKVNWSPSNRACGSSQDGFPFPDGCIGTSFYSRYANNGRNIFVLGDASGNAGDDTDEYDNHVITHEWGHYYEDVFARSDSIGGQHNNASRLDIRVAFGEGWGNAWSAIATDDSLYVDTFGTGTSGFSFDVENYYEGDFPGWWNEFSVQEILYDLYDDGANDNDVDGVALGGFAPLHAVLTTDQKTTAAVTSIFSFIDAIKRSNDSTTALLVDDLLRGHDISPINDAWGSGRVAGFDAGPADNTDDQYASDGGTVIPDISGEIGSAIGVCSSNVFHDVDQTGTVHEYNRIGARRFLRFQVPSSGNWQITLNGVAGDDPDFYLMERGELLRAGEGTGASETHDVDLAMGTTYVLEVLDWNNADDDAATPADGVDEICHNLTITQN